MYPLLLYINLVCAHDGTQSGMKWQLVSLHLIKIALIFCCCDLNQQYSKGHHVGKNDVKLTEGNQLMISGL